MSYRLLYFPIRGRGEQIRLLFHLLGQPYEDVAVVRERFLALKREGAGTLAFGSLPLLEEEDGFRLVQGPAIMSYLARKHGVAPESPREAARADAITLGAEDLRSRFFGLFGEGAAEKQAAFLAGDWRERWLPSLEGLLRLSGTGLFVGDAATHADLAVWDAIDGVLTRVQGASLEGHPQLIAHRERVAALPGVAAYLAERR